MRLGRRRVSQSYDQAAGNPLSARAEDLVRSNRAARGLNRVGSTVRGLDASLLDRTSQRFGVAFVLVGVRLGECCQAGIESVAGAEVAGDGDGVTGTRVCP